MQPIFFFHFFFEEFNILFLLQCDFLVLNWNSHNHGKLLDDCCWKLTWSWTWLSGKMASIMQLRFSTVFAEIFLCSLVFYFRGVLVIRYLILMSSCWELQEFVRKEALHMLQNALEGSGGCAAFSAYTEAFRLITRFAVGDKSFVVRIAAARCLKAFANIGGPGLGVGELDSSASYCVKVWRWCILLSHVHNQYVFMINPFFYRPSKIPFLLSGMLLLKH